MSLWLTWTLPATAAGARIELRAGYSAGTSELLYTGDPGERNDPGVYRYEDWYYLWDTAGVPTERVAPCEANPEHTGLGVSSRCPSPNPGVMVTSAVIDLGDQDDLGHIDQNTVLDIPVTVLGGSGRDRLSMHSEAGNVIDGGPGDDVLWSEVPGVSYPIGGKDTVRGGDGRDEIHTRDDKRDVVSCGPDADEAIVDELDDVAADCETVRRRFDSSWARADGRAIGVTINAAATYTNNVDVLLTVRAPDPTTHLRLANDGGFASWLTLMRTSAEVYPFELPSTGPERLPKTVYVRLDGPGLDPSRTLTDDIILDQTPPAVRLARVVHRTRRGVGIALEARDTTSGLRSAQFARTRTRPWRRHRYRRRITVRRVPHWARVHDRARNRSRWIRVRPR